jgi:ATP-dependent RNA helicase DeaD
MTQFNSLNLPEFLVRSLDRMSITTPTPIQAEAIPLAMAGRDILASSQTGSGKTIAFLVPLIIRLLEDVKSTALVLTPTRELAVQVRDALQKLLGREAPFSAALLIGGEPMPKQFLQLKRRPRLIVGTPGRVTDHLQRGSLKLDEARFLVLDETDRMLDMGFSEQLDDILNYIPQARQTLMFSATMPANIVKLSQKYLTEPERVSIGSPIKAAIAIQQDVAHVKSSEKFPRLLKELDERDESIIVFVKTKRGAEELAEKLKDNHHRAEAIHGDLNQRKRDRVVKAFRMQKSRIMVATDVAARGLDIPHIKHVINYDLPQCPEDYIHRIGRTGRASAQGNALSLISPEDKHKWKMIHRLMNPDAPQEKEERSERPSGKKPFRKSSGGKAWGAKFPKKTFSGKKPEASKANHQRFSKKKVSQKG